MKTYLAIYLGAVAVSLLATMGAIRLAQIIGAMDKPGLRKVHTKSIPRIGGIAIIVATVGLVLPALLLDNVIGGRLRESLPQVFGLLLAGAFIFAVGLLDDIRGLPARYKLLSQLAAAAFLCSIGLRIDTLEVRGLFRMELGWVSWPVTALWIVGITNAINLIDGLDGLAAGISAVTCGVIATFVIYTNQPVMAVLMLAMLGSLTGFLFFNFNPARIFLGDCGSLFLGFVLAGASILSSTKSATAVGLALPVLAMGIPVLDTLFSMLRRALQRRSIFAADREHIHHRLLGMGLNQRHVVLVLYGATVLAAGMGMFMMITHDIGTLLVFGCVLLLLSLMFRAVGLVRMHGVVEACRQNLAISRRGRKDKHDFEEARLRLREATSLGAWWRAVCESADKMGIARLAIICSGDSIVTRTLLRHRAEDSRKTFDTIGIVVPVATFFEGAVLHAQLDVYADGPLEVVGRRATLFGRLLEESIVAVKDLSEEAVALADKVVSAPLGEAA